MAITSASTGTPPEQSASCIVGKTAAGSHTLTIDGYSRIKDGISNCRTKTSTSATFTVGGHRWCIDGRMIRIGGADWIFMFLSVRRDGKEEVSAVCDFTLLDHNGEPSYSRSVAGGGVCPMLKNIGRTVVPFIETKFLESRTGTYLRGDRLRVRCEVTVYKEPRCEDRAVPSCLVAVPPPDIGDHLGRLLSSGVGADLTVQVAGGETFAVHRHILAVRSPVLLEEIVSGCLTKRMEAAMVFKAVLHYIYTDSLPPEIDEGETTSDKARHLIAAADGSIWP